MATKAISKTKRAKELGISRASIYYRSKQDTKDWQTKTKIEEMLHIHPSYGHKRLAVELKLNKKRILRVMKKYGIKPYRRHGKKWKKSKENGCVFSNLLCTTIPLYPNHIWASDFTHLSWKGKTIYLATILDIFTREIVGFSVMLNHGTLLVMNALLMAVMRYGRPEILHSDQGSEYASKAYVDLVDALGIRQSMSRKASPWENGYQESWYDKCKIDLGDLNRFESLGEVVANIYQHIYYYNSERIHTTLKMAPKQYAMLQSLKALTEEIPV
jgi:transposase InsO family protein